LTQEQLKQREERIKRQLQESSEMKDSTEAIELKHASEQWNQLYRKISTALRKMRE